MDLAFAIAACSLIVSIIATAGLHMLFDKSKNRPITIGCAFAAASAALGGTITAPTTGIRVVMGTFLALLVFFLFDALRNPPKGGA